MDAEYIEGNTESIVFYSDVKEIVELFELDGKEADLMELVNLYLKKLGVLSPELESVPLADLLAVYP